MAVPLVVKNRTVWSRSVPSGQESDGLEPVSSRLGGLTEVASLIFWFNIKKLNPTSSVDMTSFHCYFDFAIPSITIKWQRSNSQLYIHCAPVCVLGHRQRYLDTFLLHGQLLPVTVNN